jgi:hypothetical protein
LELQKIGSKGYAFLPSGILIVEPDPGLLSARVLLLTAAERYVSVSSVAVAGSELEEIKVSAAVLSQSLGESTLTILAQDVRVLWPNAPILILGRNGLNLDGQLFDEAIDRCCRPEELLNSLFRLTHTFGDRLSVQQTRIDASVCN